MRIAVSGSREISGEEAYVLFFSGLLSSTENGLGTLNKLNTLVDVLIPSTAATGLTVVMPNNGIDGTQGYAYSSSAG